MTMIRDNEAILKEVSNMNPITQLWAKIGIYAILKHKLLKFIKLLEITRVLASMEDKCCFSIVVFIKNNIRKHFTCHLDLCNWFYALWFFAIANFPFEKAINLQANTKWWYYVDFWNHIFLFEWQLHFTFQVLGCATLHCSRVHNAHLY